MSRRHAALALLLLAAAGPTPQQLQDAEHAHATDLAEQRAAAARAADAARQQAQLAAGRVAAAARLGAAEDALTAAAAQVADLTTRRAALARREAAGAAAFGALLPTLTLLALYPAETLLALPLPPEQAVRGEIVLAGLTQRLNQDAAALRTEQADMAAVQAQLDAALPALTAAEAEQARLAAALDAAIAAAAAARREAGDAADAAALRAAADAARADTLRAAIARIEADRRAAAERQHAATAAEAQQEALAQPAGPGLGGPQGQLAAPVAGTLLRGFGAATEAGPASGATYATPPAARVVAPCGGTVVFAGPFRSFGLLLILDCGGGYHVVLAGLDRLDAAAGRRVAAGEPVGVMATWDPRRPDAARPALYVELRKDGAPVDPAPFLHARS